MTSSWRSSIRREIKEPILIHPPQTNCVCASLNATHTQNPSRFLYPTTSLRTVPSEVKASQSTRRRQGRSYVVSVSGEIKYGRSSGTFLKGTNKCRQGQVTSVPGAPMAGRHSGSPIEAKRFICNGSTASRIRSSKPVLKLWRRIKCMSLSK